MEIVLCLIIVILIGIGIYGLFDLRRLRRIKSALDISKYTNIQLSFKTYDYLSALKSNYELKISNNKLYGVISSTLDLNNNIVHYLIEDSNNIIFLNNNVKEVFKYNKGNIDIDNLMFSWEELIQIYIWNNVSDSLLTYLNNDNLNSLIIKLFPSNKYIETLNYLNDNSVFKKKYDKLMFDKKLNRYEYTDKEDNLYYYIQDNKLIKIEGLNIKTNESFVLELSYNDSEIIDPVI